MTQALKQRTTALTRHMLAGHMMFGLLLWGGFVIFVASLVICVAIFRGIEVSGWEQAATQAPRWYLLFIGTHLGYSALALHVAFGQTRRSFARQAALFIIVFAAFGAVLMAIGFVLEAGLYQLAEWPQALSLTHLFTSPDQLHLIFTEFWLRFLVWTAAGALLGAAFYRDPGLGGIAVLPVIVLVAAAEMALAPAHWWPFGSVPPFLELGVTSVPLPVAMAVPILSFLLISALAWVVVRDIPLRNKGVE